MLPSTAPSPVVCKPEEVEWTNVRVDRESNADLQRVVNLNLLIYASDALISAIGLHLKTSMGRLVNHTQRAYEMGYMQKLCISCTSF